jgi:hypothetical protein
MAVCHAVEDVHEVGIGLAVVEFGRGSSSTQPIVSLAVSQTLVVGTVAPPWNVTGLGQSVAALQPCLQLADVSAKQRPPVDSLDRRPLGEPIQETRINPLAGSPCVAKDAG